MCADGWGGSDCSTPLDSSSLVWETLLDTQLTAVRTRTHIYKNTPTTECHSVKLPPPSTEPGPQVPPPDGPFSSVWAPGEPLDVWRPLSLRGHPGKRLQVWGGDFLMAVFLLAFI